LLNSRKLVLGREERSSSVHTLIESITPRTCATTATTEKGNPRWLTLVATRTSLTTQVGCARTAISPSTTSRERIRWRRKKSKNKKPPRRRRPSKTPMILKHLWSVQRDKENPLIMNSACPPRNKELRSEHKKDEGDLPSIF
jgi:hypothetical protein